jgi:hypothetical protein
VTKSETRGNGTLASVHLVLPSRGIAKTFCSAILGRTLGDGVRQPSQRPRRMTFLRSKP